MLVERFSYCGLSQFKIGHYLAVSFGQMSKRFEIALNRTRNRFLWGALDFLKIWTIYR